MLIGKGGYYANVFRITPPLCFTKDDAGRFFCFCFYFSYSQNQTNEIVFASFFLCSFWFFVFLFLFFPRRRSIKLVELVIMADFLVDVMDYAMAKL